MHIYKLKTPFSLIKNDKEIKIESINIQFRGLNGLNLLREMESHIMSFFRKEGEKSKQQVDIEKKVDIKKTKPKSDFEVGLDSNAKKVAFTNRLKNVESIEDLENIDKKNKNEKFNSNQFLLAFKISDEYEKVFCLISKNLENIITFKNENLCIDYQNQIDSEILFEIVDEIIKKYAISKIASVLESF